MKKNENNIEFECMKIALVSCYYGAFPWYFELFLKSCNTNSEVDFFIFTDIVYSDDLPDNVKIIPLSFSALKALISTKLELEITLESPYKLCDFKPTYGVVFSEYLVGYDFWGMCDIDIVLGRIRTFMTEDLLSTYDVISVRDDYPTGCFMLFRNEIKTNRLYTKSKDYKKVFTSTEHFCFDECNHQNIALSAGVDLSELSCEIESMHHVLLKETKLGNIKTFFDFLVIEGFPGKMIWENGVLVFQKEYEILLYHLILYKDNFYANKGKQKWKTIPDKFFIDRYNIRMKSRWTLLGFFEHLWFEKIYILKNKFLHQADYYFSILLGGKELSFLKTGIYKSGPALLNIQKSSTGIKELFYGKKRDPAFTNSLVKSFFYRDRFVIKGERYLKYLVEKKGALIRVIYFDGSSIPHKKI